MVLEGEVKGILNFVVCFVARRNSSNCVLVGCSYKESDIDVVVG